MMSERPPEFHSLLFVIERTSRAHQTAATGHVLWRKWRTFATVERGVARVAAERTSERCIMNIVSGV